MLAWYSIVQHCTRTSIPPHIFRIPKIRKKDTVNLVYIMTVYDDECSTLCMNARNYNGSYMYGISITVTVTVTVTLTVAGT